MPEVSSMSILTFENNAFIVRVNKVGGELCGFYSKKTETEYIWSGDPGVWASTAPVLFPNYRGVEKWILSVRWNKVFNT